MSDYLRGVVQIPIERKHLANARRWAAAVVDKYDADIEVNETSLYIVIRPGPKITVDGLLKLKDMARAVSLGFPPEEALKLEKEGYYLDSLDLKEYADKPNHLARIKGRVIGENGRAKATIEALTGAKIIVGERHIAILGPANAVLLAREAITMLIEGRRHSTVYKYLQRARPGGVEGAKEGY